MSNLYIFNETFTSGLNYNLLTVISLIAVLCGVLVIISKNPIVSVLYLIGLFLSIAIYLIMLGIHFIGLSYLLVYVGAVSILFLFILMLINVRISELVTDNNNSIPLAIMIGIIYSFTLYRLFPSTFKAPVATFSEKEHNASDLFHNEYHKFELSIGNNVNETTSNNLSNIYYFFKETTSTSELSYATSLSWDGALTEFSHITSIGNIIYTVYPMWLILTSLILLLAMVGAIVITIKQ